MIVADGSVHEQYHKVNGVVVGNNAVKAADQTPGQSHEVVAGVIDLAGPSPPASGQQFRAAFGLEKRQVRDRRIVGVAPKDVLLAVGTPKNGVSHSVDGHHRQQLPPAQGRIVVDQIASLQAVGKGNPAQVTKQQHKAKAVGGNIHGRQDGFFLVEGIPDVDPLKEVDQQHGTRHEACRDKLLVCRSSVEENPSNQARTQFTKLLPIKVAVTDARIQFPADEKVVTEISGIATRRQNLGLACRIFPKRVPVEVGVDDKAQSRRGARQFREVLVDWGPVRKAAALNGSRNRIPRGPTG